MCDICQPKIAGEEEDQKHNVDEGRGIDACEQQFEEGEHAVQAVFGDVGPQREGCSEAPEVWVEDAPIYDCDEEG